MKLVDLEHQRRCGLDGVVSPQRIAEGARALADAQLMRRCLQEISAG
jgi:hypothetical protein